MEREFWSQRWETGETRFHLERVNPHLERHLTRWLGERAGAHVLVPLCGKTLDLAWLAEHGCHVHGVEFVALAVRQLFAEHSWTADVERRGPFEVQRARECDVEVLCGDVFDLAPRDLPPIDAILDRAAWIALPRDARARYAAKLAELARPGTRLLLVALDHDLDSGPPFAVTEQEVRELAGGAFTLELVDTVDLMEREPRWRERGATRALERVWIGERRA